MENATEALKMAAAVMIFAIAITITFSFISRAKTTADAVISYTDKTTLRETKKVTENENGERLVGIETVISTIYRCKTEKIAVIVIDGTTKYEFNLDIYKTKGDKTIKEQLSEDIISFVSTHIKSKDQYLESFTESTYSGNYQTADDGTTLTITSGSSKIYITYTKQ